MAYIEVHKLDHTAWLVKSTMGQELGHVRHKNSQDKFHAFPYNGSLPKTFDNPTDAERYINPDYL